MKLKIEINMDNHIFTIDPVTETERILKKYATEIQHYGFNRKLMDINGNSIGVAGLIK